MLNALADAAHELSQPKAEQSTSSLVTELSSLTLKEKPQG